MGCRYPKSNGQVRGTCAQTDSCKWDIIAMYVMRWIQSDKKETRVIVGIIVGQRTNLSEDLGFLYIRVLSKLS